MAEPLPVREKGSEGPIDVVVAAQNEEATIRDVIRALLRATGVGTVLVALDPDTTDNTVMYIPHNPRVKVMMSPNHGKGQTALYGLMAVETQRVIFCDADYRGLHPLHVEALCRAYSGGQIIGVRDIPCNYPEGQLWAWKWVSGFRCVPTEVVRGLRLHGYLMETQINHAVGALCGRPTLHIRMRGLKSPYNMTPRRQAARETDRKWGLDHGILQGGTILHDNATGT